jgi:hypothetical protein
MYTSLLYNINVATSITSQGRALVSSASMQFEMFLANNVKFGSLNEVVEFINHIVNEKKDRKFKDYDWIDEPVKLEDCFAKIVLTCGYRWIPDDDDLEVIWRILSNLSQEDLNRVYYKNNLYEFMSNKNVIQIVKVILRKLHKPLFNSLDIPEEIADDIKFFSDLLMEYVYYKYMIIDRIDRCDNMIKSVIMVSDTDSTIISLDAWYRFISEQVNGEELKIFGYNKDFFEIIGKDEDGEYTSTPWKDCVSFEPKKYDFNFETDEIVERMETNHPETVSGYDNVRYSIINILAYVLDRVINDYMEQFCLNNHSLSRDKETGKFNRKCKILMKNEFTFKRLMMTKVKKNYASLIAVQEGNLVPENKQLDVKGIECFTKSTKSENTRKALKKILLDDVLNTPVIDQLRFVKDIAVFERRIIESVRAGNREYFKPVTIKSQNSYDNPLRIQGIKASIAWNGIKPDNLPTINLEERNAIDIVKVNINKATIDKIADSNPEIYQNMIKVLEMEEFGGSIEAIALPLDVNIPDWLLEFVDYTDIVNENIGGVPYESIGIMTMNKPNVNYTNIVEL